MAVIIKFPTAVARGEGRRQHDPVELMAQGNTVLRFPAPAPEPEKDAPASPAAPAPADSPRKGRAAGRIEDQRKAMLAKIHIALGKLQGRLEGFNEDVYRYTLGVRWGVDSAAQMDIGQLDEVLAWLAELGFQSTRPFYARRDYNRSALIKKINALLAEKRNKEGGCFLGMEYAEGILKRQTKGAVDNVYKATRNQLHAVIAALDKDAARKGRRRH
ncbi:MAG: regulatory protein GemA [Desulfovibrio sp.]|nr:regulatory protein GemA [Desulfovibrio sp.]